MALYDLLHDTPTQETVQRACTTFDGWCAEKGFHSMRPKTLQPHFAYTPNAKEGEETLSWHALWHAFPQRLMCLWKYHGMRALELWWQEQGYALFWKNDDLFKHEMRRPPPELGHLLCFALKNKHTPLARWAFEKGWSADVRDASSARATPLHFLVQNNPTQDTVKEYDILFKGLCTPLTINSQGTLSAGASPLSLLLMKDNMFYGETSLFQWCRFLLDAGAEANKADTLGRTPLHYLFMKPDRELQQLSAILSLLLNAGADPLAPLTQAPFETPFSLLDRTSRLDQPGHSAALREIMRAFLAQRDAEVLERSLDRPQGGEGPPTGVLVQRIRGRL